MLNNQLKQISEKLKALKTKRFTTNEEKEDIIKLEKILDNFLGGNMDI